MRNERFRPVIIDSDEDFLSSLEKDPLAKDVPPILANNGEEALRLLSNRAQHYLCIFLNPILSFPGGIELIRKAREFHTGTPLYILYEHDPPFSDVEEKRLAIHGRIAKPVSYPALTQHVSGALSAWDGLNSIQSEPVDLDDRSDKIYEVVDALEYLSGKRSHFDLYIKLDSGRFVKILNANDTFTEGRVENYLKKGVRHFFVKKESKRRCLDYCRSLSKTVVSHDGVSAALKSSEVLGLGQQILSDIKFNGLRQDHIQAAKEFLANVYAMTRQINLKNSGVVEALIDSIETNQHTISVTLIAGMLASQLNIETHEAYQSVGLAAFFHDIGLFQMGENLRHEDTSRMSEEELIEFKRHPEVGAKLVQQFEGVEEVVVQAIAHHHVRRTGGGFPKTNFLNRTNTVAEIVGICDEFVHRLRLHPEKDRSAIVADMKQKVFDGFSLPVITAFKEVFCNGH